MHTILTLQPVFTVTNALHLSGKFRWNLPEHGTKVIGRQLMPRTRIGNSSDRGLTVIPIRLRDAEAFIAEHHRHNAPPRGHKFSIAVCDDDGKVRGVATV